MVKIKSIFSKLLVLLLTFLMVFSFSVPNLKTEKVKAEETKKVTALSLDAGRKYFSEQQIKDVISKISEKGYTHLHLLFGNDGLRFVLNDMTINVNNKTHTSEEVKNAINYGNEEYFKEKNVTNTENKVLTQQEMDNIFEFAKTKNIKIIPGLNMPGHMDTMLYAMQKLGYTDVNYTEKEHKSVTTINLKNKPAKEFAFAMLEKYVEYFKGKKVEAFNFGADEFANDVSGKVKADCGFQMIIDNGQYDSEDGFVGYVNRASSIIKKAGIRPMAFNDGFYYNNKPTNIAFDKDILISYWIGGYWGYNLASAEYLSKQGFEILNTHDKWYYVVGVEDEKDSKRTGNPYNRQKAINNMKSAGGKFDKLSTRNATDKQVDIVGSMQAVWSDYPGEKYEPEKVFDLIDTFSAQNPTFIKNDGKTASIPQLQPAPEVDTSLMKAFSLDAGRKYFSVESIKQLIDTLSEKGFTHFHLLFGNDGFRFLLNDLSITADGKTYTTEQVKTALEKGNKVYGDKKRIPEAENKALTEAEMNDIINYANEKGIKIIPGLNTPGHMDAIVTAMKELKLENSAFTYKGRESATTMNLENDKAINFVKELVKKYADYFKTKKDLGIEIMNFGADEYGQDVTYHDNGPSGFQAMQDLGLYDRFAQYVNQLSSIIKGAGLRPMAFNDGFYYNNKVPNVKLDTDILVSYWNSGFPKYDVAKAHVIKEKGHKILNTNDGWYYVIGNDYAGQWYGLPYATTNMKKPEFKFDRVTGEPDNKLPIEGSMVAVWCDEPSRKYNFKNVDTLLSTFVEQNKEFFKKEELANYAKVDELLEQVKGLVKENYTNFEIVDEAVKKVKRGLPVSQQAKVDAMATEIENAIGKLIEKDADYTKVNEALAKVEKLDKTKYENFDIVEKAVAGVQKGLKISQQEKVNQMAQAIEDAIGALKEKPSKPLTPLEPSKPIKPEPNKPNPDNQKPNIPQTDNQKPQNDNTSNQNVQNDNETQVTTPKTSDNENILLGMIALAGSIGALAVLKKRKKS